MPCWLELALPRLLSSPAATPVPPWAVCSLQIGEGHAHTESAWAERLPQALAFLGQPWWARQAAQHDQHLFFTSPRRLRAGQPATLFVQQGRSLPLAGHRGPLHARFAFNNWTLAGADVQMAPAPQLEPDALPAGAPAQQPKWQAASFEVPAGAYEMQFVLTDGNGGFDNNAGGLGVARVRTAGLCLGSARVGGRMWAAAALAHAALTLCTCHNPCNPPAQAPTFMCG